MKVPGIWVFFFVVGTVSFVFTSSSSSSIPGMEFSKHGDTAMFMSTTETSRKMKTNGYDLCNEKKRNVNLDDYHPIDPVPSSKSPIKHGPIPHGSPLIPFIPKPSPPDHPKTGGSS